MSNSQKYSLNDYRDNSNRDMDFLYFEWEGNSLVKENPHSHTFYMLLLTKGSNGTHTIDFLDYEVKGIQIHILFPGQVHHWDLANDTIAYQLMISVRKFELIANTLHFNTISFKQRQVIPLTEDDFQDLIHEFRSIKKELSPAIYKSAILQSRIRIILQIIQREAEKQVYTRQRIAYSPKLMEFIKLLEADFKTEKLPEYYAKQMNITPNYLNILCQKHAQKTASTFIKERILLEAKRQLQLSTASIKEIAYDLGFHDPGHFAKFFKHHTSMTPTDFRQEEDQ
ncbi:MAG: AraC family transcriptional regulator [Chitinophaga sp.]|uniref:AraC family transcriptional regulator n=1 Tax=Chitinophaga sp. TaxID=1869181 RepID=UPI0025C713BE|nr:helix-turn-helix domain-containing protein [Chitinophaga sp.]MBV8251407.1 AraC family transcriptional regulator [Chitinophaga sp.]